MNFSVNTYDPCGQYRTGLTISICHNTAQRNKNTLLPVATYFIRHLFVNYESIMNWQLMNQATLQERQTGFMVKLVEGTWFHPRDVQPLSPSGLDFLLQARLLRLGLLYIETLQSDRLAS